MNAERKALAELVVYSYLLGWSLAGVLRAAERRAVERERRLRQESDERLERYRQEADELDDERRRRFREDVAAGVAAANGGELE